MLFRICTGTMAVISLCTYLLYAHDKSKARRKGWRIPEKVLLGFSFFGGAIGGLLAMYTLRHKTKHWYFRAVNLLGVLWQIALLVYLLVQEL